MLALKLFIALAIAARNNLREERRAIEDHKVDVSDTEEVLADPLFGPLLEGKEPLNSQLSKIFRT
jgi:hypothetical protein